MDCLGFIYIDLNFLVKGLEENVRNISMIIYIYIVN